MGFMDWISPALTVGSQAAGSYLQGSQQRQQQEQNQMLQLISLKRQQKQDADEAALHAAQMGEYGVKATERKKAALTNKRFYDRLRTEFGDDPYGLGEYDEGTGYEEEYRRRADKKLTDAAARAERLRDFNAFRLAHPEREEGKVFNEDTDYKDLETAITRGPTVGSEAWYKMKEREAGIQHKYDRHDDWVGSGVDPNTGEPLLYNKYTGETKVGGGVKTGTGGGGGGALGASSADMQNAYDHYVARIGTMQKNKTPINLPMVTREAAQFGVTQSASKGEQPSMSNLLVGGALDATGLGSNQKGYNEYQSAVQAARQFGEEATRLFSGRPGWNILKMQIAEVQPSAADFNNPFTLNQKLQKMRILIERARKMEERAGLNTTTRGNRSATATGGDDELARARALINSTP